jgi:hypothetical protein
MHAPLATLLSTEELDDLSLLMARRNFGLFRQMVRPGMLWGWWTEEVADHLQQFYEEMMAGKRPKLAITAPPQTGKSWTVTDFIAWVAGRNPERKTIFGSYSDDLGVRTNPIKAARGSRQVVALASPRRSHQVRASP